MLYLVLKALHVIGVVMFLGNITTGIFWKEHADRTREPRLIAHALAGIIRSDRLFTIPGVLIITITGLSSAIVGHVPLLRTGWMFWGESVESLRTKSPRRRPPWMLSGLADRNRAGAGLVLG